MLTCCDQVASLHFSCRLLILCILGANAVTLYKRPSCEIVLDFTIRNKVTLVIVLDFTIRNKVTLVQFMIC